MNNSSMLYIKFRFFLSSLKEPTHTLRKGGENVVLRPYHPLSRGMANAVGAHRALPAQKRCGAVARPLGGYLPCAVYRLPVFLLAAELGSAWQHHLLRQRRAALLEQYALSLQKAELADICCGSNLH